MAVYRLFQNKAFEPEAIAVMTRAYSDVCRTLGVEDNDGSATNAVAQKVIEFAQRGERDPVRLRDYVLEALRNGPTDGTVGMRRSEATEQPSTR